MSYINVGAFINGKRPASKKAVREALASDPASVVFDKTAGLFDGWGNLTVADLQPGVKLSLVGPDPETKRNFYGTLELDKNGKVKVS
jgi:hypothetical protein